jgi:hypothetical protein
MIRSKLRSTGKADASENMDYFKNAFHKTCWLGCHKGDQGQEYGVAEGSRQKGTTAKLARRARPAIGATAKPGRVK